jgi:membrane-associated phospholipid phosphatase
VSAARVRAARARAAAGALVIGALLGCTDGPAAPTAHEREAGAGRWRTWEIANGAELRPAAPPASGSVVASREIDEIVRLQAARNPAVDSAIRRWAGSPTAAWDSAALDVLDFYFPLLPAVRIATPVRAARVMALLNVAMHDALVATWDAKYAYGRRAPAAADPRVRALAATGGVPSYPSEHAAAAAAAAAVLAYAFPSGDSLAWQSMARDAGEARIAAGAAYRSDVDAGAAIGRAVAARVIARARTDGATEPWRGTRPSGTGMWAPTPSKFVDDPFDAGAGSWRPWVLASAGALRPAPPPAPGSPAFLEDVAELRDIAGSRMATQLNAARYWATDAPSVIWEKDMLREVAARRLGPVTAARAHALASVAMYDAFLACWDAKFTFWIARPITTDPALRTVFPTPPFPSYPSGHSTISAAAAEVFAALFPDAASAYHARALEASLSRVYAGVHYRFDVEVGEQLGAQVGRAVVARAREDATFPRR